MTIHFPDVFIVEDHLLFCGHPAVRYGKYINGSFGSFYYHREDGPAIINNQGAQVFYYKDIKLDPQPKDTEEFIKMIKYLDF